MVLYYIKENVHIPYPSLVLRSHTCISSSRISYNELTFDSTRPSPNSSQILLQHPFMCCPIESNFWCFYIHGCVPFQAFHCRVASLQYPSKSCLPWLLIASELGLGLVPLHEGIWSGLSMHRTYACSPNCFTCADVLLHGDNTVSWIVFQCPWLSMSPQPLSAITPRAFGEAAQCRCPTSG